MSISWEIPRLRFFLYTLYKQLFLSKVFLPFTILYILTCPYTSVYVYYQDHACMSKGINLARIIILPKIHPWDLGRIVWLLQLSLSFLVILSVTLHSKPKE